MSDETKSPLNAGTRAEAVFGYQLQQALVSMETTVKKLKGTITTIQDRLNVSSEELDKRGYEAIMQPLAALPSEMSQLHELRRTLDVQREAVIMIKQSLDKICRER